MSEDAGKPIAIRRGEDGNISHIQFENRTKMTPKDQAINMVKDGKANEVRVNRTGGGKEYLQDKPDSSKSDNLANLPEK